MTRPDGRRPDELRPTRITPDILDYPEGSAEIAVGATRVLCTASLSAEVPPWMRGKGNGWITAEYQMLPRATRERTPREAARGRQKGRTVEIQRLIGRSLRAAIDLGDLGEAQVVLDCDVLQADGGTRTASISGAWVALAVAVERAAAKGVIKRRPPIVPVAAVSVGIVRGTPVLDLPYVEDAGAEVDMNVVMTGDGRLVEVQGTGEAATFSREDLAVMLDLAAIGCEELFVLQRGAVNQALAATT